MLFSLTSWAGISFLETSSLGSNVSTCESVREIEWGCQCISKGNLFINICPRQKNSNNERKLGRNHVGWLFGIFFAKLNFNIFCEHLNSCEKMLVEIRENYQYVSNTQGFKKIYVLSMAHSLTCITFPN